MSPKSKKLLRIWFSQTSLARYWHLFSLIFPAQPLFNRKLESIPLGALDELCALVLAARSGGRFEVYADSWDGNDDDVTVIGVFVIFQMCLDIIFVTDWRSAASVH